MQKKHGKKLKKDEKGLDTGKGACYYNRVASGERPENNSTLTNKQ